MPSAPRPKRYVCTDVAYGSKSKDIPLLDTCVLGLTFYFNSECLWCMNASHFQFTLWGLPNSEIRKNILTAHISRIMPFAVGSRSSYSVSFHAWKVNQTGADQGHNHMVLSGLRNNVFGLLELALEPTAGAWSNAAELLTEDVQKYN